MKAPIVKIAILLLAVWAVSSGMDRLILAKGDSVPDTVYWRLPNAIPEVNNYVTLTINHAVTDHEDRHITKQIVCGPGQSLIADGVLVSCDGRVIGEYLKQTWDGKPLTPFLFNGVIPENAFFLGSQHSRSFDSRYIGLVQGDELEVVIGLF